MQGDSRFNGVLGKVYEYEMPLLDMLIATCM